MSEISHKEKIKKFPWHRTYCSIKSRLATKGRTYQKKGIKNYLTVKEIEFLWNRDKADVMKKPSIDRIDNDGHYTLSNCRFIEFSDNARRGVYIRRVPRGENCPASKLTEREVLAIRKIREENPWLSCAKIGKPFKTSRENVKDIVNRRSWRHI